MILLTSSECAPCIAIKSFIEDNKIEGVQILSTADESAQILIAAHRVRSVPTLIVDNRTITGANEIMEKLRLA